MNHPPSGAALLALPTEFEAQLEGFIGLIEAWRSRVNLVSRNTTGDALRQHALSSLAVLDPAARDLMAPGAGTDQEAGPGISAERAVRLLDIGSGGGFPALVLLMARPAWRGVLVEATGKKCFFLREAGERFAPGRATVLHQRYEEPSEERGAEAEAAAGPFDLVTLRAVRPDVKLVTRMRVRLSSDLAPGGWVAWYAPQDEEGRALAHQALEYIGLEDIAILRIEWAGATLAIGRKPLVSRGT
jgi:16S rRNA (guanine527-N7)-methyltransferase